MLISESDRRTLETFRREELGAGDPLTLTLATGPARVVREPPGGLRRGDAIYVALVGEWSRADEWKDFFLHDHCTDPSPNADFGVCLDVHGQMLGVIVEGSRIIFPRALDEIQPWDAHDTRCPRKLKRSYPRGVCASSLRNCVPDGTPLRFELLRSA